ncbi:hypothetical protein FRC12_012658, partial [Ceratobasidium sp. 428]
MAINNLDYVVLFTALVATWIWLRRKVRTPNLPLPPGPPRWPFIGSALSLPRSEPSWETFIRWGEESNSDVIYAPMPGSNLVILNSHEAAVELLEHRSAVYSGRPRLVMAGDLVGWDRILGLISDANQVKRVRKLLHDGINQKAMQNWRPLQEQDALRFVQRLLHTPQDLVAHIRQTAAATVVKLTYGYTVHDISDEYIMAAEQAMASFSRLGTPGAFMVDIFPWLRYIPWAPFKKVAAEAREHLNRLENMPMRFVRQQMEAGGGEYSLVSKWLENPKRDKDYEDMIKSSAAALYAGGADT